MAMFTTVYTEKRRFNVPGEPALLGPGLSRLMEKLGNKRFWWGGHKVWGVGIRHVHENTWEITLKTRRTNRHLPKLWAEVRKLLQEIVLEAQAENL
ncbi:MAG: hypothetical protein IIC90_10565 [Chloroflexi bacterium]|nr:hypothetical protein [Chloroflexota bacterium]